MKAIVLSLVAVVLIGCALPAIARPFLEADGDRGQFAERQAVVAQQLVACQASGALDARAAGWLRLDLDVVRQLDTRRQAGEASFVVRTLEERLDQLEDQVEHCEAPAPQDREAHA